MAGTFALPVITEGNVASSILCVLYKRSSKVVLVLVVKVSQSISSNLNRDKLVAASTKTNIKSVLPYKVVVFPIVREVSSLNSQFSILNEVKLEASAIEILDTYCKPRNDKPVGASNCIVSSNPF